MQAQEVGNRLKGNLKDKASVRGAAAGRIIWCDEASLLENRDEEWVLNFARENRRSDALREFVAALIEEFQAGRGLVTIALIHRDRKEFAEALPARVKGEGMFRPEGS